MIAEYSNDLELLEARLRKLREMKKAAEELLSLREGSLGAWSAFDVQRAKETIEICVREIPAMERAIEQKERHLAVFEDKKKHFDYDALKEERRLLELRAKLG